MVDKTWRNLLQRKIDHRVRPYDHRIRSRFQFSNDPAKDGVIDVEVIGIKLYGVLSAGSGINRLVPASADSQVPAFRNDVFETRIADSAQDLGRPIRRMVIDDDHVEIEISSLNECALNGLENCPLPISNRYDDAGFHWKGFRCGWNFLEVRMQPGIDSF